MQLPRIYHFLSRHCHCYEWNALCIPTVAGAGCSGAAEEFMKIYLLIMLIGSLLTAVHFTSAPKQPSKSLPQ
jgi:hypothetical protein